MAQQTSLQAAARSSTGKGAARSLRREGKVPGVIYGHGRDPEPVAIDALALQKMLIGISAASTVVDVAIDSRPSVKVLLREIQRDPIRPGHILHVDLYEIHADEKITVEVPVHLIGIPDGVRNFAGVLDQVLREVEIEVFPGDIPDRVELDVTALGIGDSLYVRDLKIEKAEILNDPDVAVATVVAPRIEEVVAPAEEPASTEPELIRKPKTEAEDADEKA